MFAMLNFDLENFDSEKCIQEINEYKDTNQSLACMLQSMLNKYEKHQGLPLTKIVEPPVIIDAKTGEILPFKNKESE